MTERLLLCSECFDELQCPDVLGIICRQICQRCGRLCLGYIADQPRCVMHYRGPVTDPTFDEQIRAATAMTFKEVMEGDLETAKLLQMLIPIIEHNPISCHARAYALLFGFVQVELSRLAGIPTDFDHNLKIFGILSRKVFDGGMLDVFGVEPAAAAAPEPKPGRLLQLVKKESDHAPQVLIDLPGDAPDDQGKPPGVA